VYSILSAEFCSFKQKNRQQQNDKEMISIKDNTSKMPQDFIFNRIIIIEEGDDVDDGRQYVEEKQFTIYNTASLLISSSQRRRSRNGVALFFVDIVYYYEYASVNGSWSEREYNIQRCLVGSVALQVGRQHSTQAC